MNKKKLLVLALVATASGSLIGCTPSTSSEPGGRRSILAWINTGNEYDGAYKDSIWQHIEEQTGVTINITGATHGTSYYQTLNPRLASASCNLDIVFSVPSNVNCSYETLIGQDIYWNIEELLLEKPGVYKNIEAILRSDVYKNISYGDNIHSLIPYITSRSGWTIYYRSDWLINVGYYTEVNGEKVAKVPVTINEMEEVMKLFTENDPDQNGKNDTYAISPAGNFFYQNPLYHAFGVTPDYDLDENNKATYMYTQEEFRDYLEWINKMYNNGYIDPEFSANAANTEDRNKFYKGNVGILITNGENHVEWVIPGVEKGQGKKDIVTVGPAPVGTATLGKEGVGGFSDWGGWWGGYSIYKHYNGSTPDKERAYASLAVLDYLYSEEGGLTRTYGIKDTHWHYDEDGNIVPLYEARIEERDNTFTAVEDENGNAKLSGTYKMGTAWGNRIIWENNNFIPEVSATNIPYEHREIFNQTVELNNVVSSRLVNFTRFAEGFNTKMNLFEKEMDRYATEITTMKNFDPKWEDELARLNNNYSWTLIQEMIEEQARNAGVI